MSLLNDIKIAQVRAGEDAVCRRLEQLGLVDRKKESQIEADARRYRFLRNADIDSIEKGGLFAGKTPDNIVINGEDLDAEIDKLSKSKA